MKKINTSAFTFVELIVVLAILGILSTIGFTAYQSYLEAGRDTNRVVQMSDIHDGLELLSVNTKLPFPEDMVQLEASGAVFAYQGYAGKSVIDAISYDGGGLDPEHNVYFTYMLDDNGRDFQLMTFLTDPGYLSNLSGDVYAAVDYESLYPKVIGKPLGILIDSTTQAPIHTIEGIKNVGEYDVVTGTGTLKAYYSDTQFIRSDVEELTQIIGNQNCKRILDTGHSKGNGTYTIIPDGVTKISVYCDMEVDGGGWTLIARSVKNTTYSGNFGWLHKTGTAKSNRSPYSMGEDVKKIGFSELMFGPYDFGKNIREFDSSETGFNNWTPAENETKYILSKLVINDIEPLISEDTNYIAGQYDFTKSNEISPFLCFYKCQALEWGKFQNTSNYYFSPSYNNPSYGMNASGFVNGIYANEAGMIFIR